MVISSPVELTMKSSHPSTQKIWVEPRATSVNKLMPPEKFLEESGSLPLP